MKLKNKKTGEIATLTLSSNGEELLLMKNNEMVTRNVKLLDLEEWEDYEEPKVYYYISDFGAIRECEIGKFPEDEEDRKQIGNYFETKEEAEKAVEQLKALNRLKDKGMFAYLDHLDFQLQEGSINFEFNKNLTNEEMNEADKDLDLLFGVEE